MTLSTNQFFRLAFNQIDISRRDINAHLAAVIVRGGSVISVGTNAPKMHSYLIDHAHHDGVRGLHAELDAIFRARRKTDLRGCKMYVARLTRTGRPGLAMPCEMCRRALERYGICRVYYTVDETSYAMLKLKASYSGWQKR